MPVYEDGVNLVPLGIRVDTCGFQPTDRWVERERREWDEDITRMDTETLVKISRDNKPARGRSPGRPKVR